MSDILRIQYLDFCCDIAVDKLIEVPLPQFRRLLRYFFYNAREAEVSDFEDAFREQITDAKYAWKQASEEYANGVVTSVDGYDITLAVALGKIGKKEANAIKRKNRALKKAIPPARKLHERWNDLYNEYQLIKETYYNG